MSGKTKASDEITQVYLPTPGGNAVVFFYNPENNLVVVDLANDGGGIELLRITLDEKKLLKHTKKVYLPQCTCDDHEEEDHPCPYSCAVECDNAPLCSCCPVCTQACEDSI